MEQGTGAPDAPAVTFLCPGRPTRTRQDTEFVRLPVSSEKCADLVWKSFSSWSASVSGVIKPSPLCVYLYFQVLIVAEWPQLKKQSMGRRVRRFLGMSGESIRLWYSRQTCVIKAQYLLGEGLTFLSQQGPFLCLVQSSLWVVPELSGVIPVPSCSKKMWDTVRTPHFSLIRITWEPRLDWRQADTRLGMLKMKYMKCLWWFGDDFIDISSESFLFIPCPYLHFTEALCAILEG